MIDTFKILTPEYSFKEFNSFETKFIRKQGQLAQVGGPYCNRLGGNLSFTEKGEWLCIVGQVPKLLYGSSYYETTEQDIEPFFEIVNQEAELAGVNLSHDMGDFVVSRVDYCQNIQVENQIPNYVNAISKLSMSRREKAEFGVETVTFKNKSQQLAFYDKIEQLRYLANKDKNDKARVEQLSFLQDKAKLLRYEVRLMRKPVCDKELGSSKVVDIWSQAKAQGKLQKEFRKLLRSGSQLSFDFVFENDKQRLERYKDKRDPVGRFLKTRSIQDFLIAYGYDWKVILELFMSVLPRSSAYRSWATLKDLYQEELRHDKIEGSPIQELQEKILGEVAV